MLLQAREPGTTVSLQMPSGRRGDEDNYIAQDFDALHWVRSFAAFNPHTTLSYQTTSP
jgi:hypothetical protein